MPVSNAVDIVVGCKAKEVFTFTDFEKWVDWAGKAIAGVAKANGTVLVCIDSGGYLCHIGEDFMEARDNNRFPVTAFLLTRSVKIKGE